MIGTDLNGPLLLMLITGYHTYPLGSILIVPELI